MTSILHYRDPIACRSDFMNTSIYQSPHMDQSRRSPPYDGHSSGSEAKHNSANNKKRPSRAGTRSVTTLTAAQLERKRANDREAQRAIRQRTKDHIDTLERQVRDLSAQLDSNSSSKLMDLMQRNEELEQENAVLRARLSHAVSALSVPEQSGGKQYILFRQVVRCCRSSQAFFSLARSLTDSLQAHLHPAIVFRCLASRDGRPPKPPGVCTQCQN